MSVTVFRLVYPAGHVRYEVRINGVGVGLRHSQIEAEDLAHFYADNPSVAADLLTRAQGWRYALGLSATAAEIREEAR